MEELSEMEMRILSELIEDWETIATIANTVTHRTGADEERAQIKVAVEKLVQADLVRLAKPPPAGARWEEMSKAGSLEVAAELETYLQFDPETKHWSNGGTPGPELSITDAGLERVHEIRDERPERWWEEEDSETKETGN